MSLLWSFATRVYQRPTVAEACLALQDQHGQNTCLLLWAAWARCLDPTTLAAAAKTAQAWEVAAVGPLRELRRALKAPREGLQDAGRESVRESIKAVELAAERRLLEALEPFARTGAPAALLPALAAASDAWGLAAPELALARLARALEDRERDLPGRGREA